MKQEKKNWEFSEDRKSVLSKITLLFLMVPLMGATAADGCNSTPSKACNVASCTTGQVLVCCKQCVAPIAVGSPCSLDLCSAAGTCAEKATCVPTGSGNQDLDPHGVPFPFDPIPVPFVHG
jgi:hypothetical protein